MKSQTQTAANGRRTALLRLLGICAAVALLALLWTAAGASAQRGPTVTVEYGGLARDAEESIQDQIHFNRSLSLDRRAPGSLHFGSASWACINLRCRYLKVSWSGIYAGVITLTRNRIPTAETLGLPLYRFQTTPVATQMSLRIYYPAASPQYVPMAGAGEEVTVTVKGGVRASAVVKIPAPDRPAAFNSRVAADQVGSTLVVDPDDSELPMLMSVWRKVEGASHYEVQYTFRTRSKRGFTKVTRLSRFGSDVTGAPGHQGYGDYNAEWGEHPNPAVRGLQNSDFRDDGEWTAVLITLPELLAGADGWPEDEPAAKAEILAALRQGKSAIGIRVRPLAACATFTTNNLCYSRFLGSGTLPLWGRQSVISYVKFKGANAQEWISSAGGG